MKTVSSGVPAACRSARRRPAATLVGAGRDVLDEDRDHGVDGRVGRDVLDRPARSPPAISAATSWTGPATTDSRRQPRAQRAWVSADRVATLQAGVRAGVGADDQRPARVGDDPHAAPRGERLLGQDGGGVEQVVQAVAADHARAGEQGVDVSVGRRDQRAGVRARPPAPRRTSAPP